MLVPEFSKPCDVYIIELRGGGGTGTFEICVEFGLV